MAGVATGILERHGRLENVKCATMRRELMELDTQGSGLVPLKRFYSSPHSQKHSFEFAESVEYLEAIGALDKSSSSEHPQVRIANYVLGPSNCVAHGSYYSMCCMSECEVLMGELEGIVQAPAASAEDLINVIGNLSSSTVDAPRILPRALQQRLGSIAARSGGQVPLHGRLFAQ